MLATESEIKKKYEDEATAKGYIAERFVSELNRLLHERQVEAIQSAIDQLRPGRVLEIAPGPGRLTRCLRAPGPLVCLEYNAAMIAEGRAATGPGVNWVRGNGFHLPFSPSFDLVYTFRFIRHFHRADRARLYGEIRRLLRPGGLFLMDAVNGRVSGPLRRAHPEAYPVYDKLYRKDELFAELVEAGFAPLSATPVQKFYRVQYQSQVFLGVRAAWINRLVVRGLESLPIGNGLEWIVACRRV
jgi:SAM-dependent methyltransferase